MKGNAGVLGVLNEALGDELTAIMQYFLDAEIIENLGLGRLAAQIKAEAKDEMRHAEALIERILFLEGHPELSGNRSVHAKRTVAEMLEQQLAMEAGAVALYNRAVGFAESAGDNGSRDLLTRILKDEERHHDFLDTQLQLMRSVGVENYLARQIPEDGE